MQTINAHSRKSIRVPAYDYSAPGAYFVTVVAAGRACLFGQVDGEQMQLYPAGRIADERWRAIPQHFPNVELGAFVIMPNHVHGILVLQDHAVGATHGVARATQWVAPTEDMGPRGPARGSIGAIIGSYKSVVTHLVGHAVWQRNYYEHIVRNEAEWNRIHLYIECNMVNWEADEENPAMP